MDWYTSLEWTVSLAVRFPYEVWLGPFLQEVSIVGAFVAIVGFVLVSTSLFSSKLELFYIPFMLFAEELILTLWTGEDSFLGSDLIGSIQTS